MCMCDCLDFDGSYDKALRQCHRLPISVCLPKSITRTVLYLKFSFSSKPGTDGRLLECLNVTSMLPNVRFQQVGCTLETHRSKLCDDATDWIHFQSHPLDARIGRAVSTNTCEIRLISVLLPIRMPMFLILCHYWLQRSKTFGNWLLTLPPLEKSRPRSQRGSIQCHCFPLFRRRNKKHRNAI